MESEAKTRAWARQAKAQEEGGTWKGQGKTRHVSGRMWNEREGRRTRRPKTRITKRTHKHTRYKYVSLG